MRHGTNQNHGKKNKQNRGKNAARVEENDKPTRKARGNWDSEAKANPYAVENENYGRPRAANTFGDEGGGNLYGNSALNADADSSDNEDVLASDRMHNRNYGSPSQYDTQNEGSRTKFMGGDEDIDDLDVDDIDNEVEPFDSHKNHSSRRDH